MILPFSQKTVNMNSFQILKEHILAQVSQMPRSILALGNPKVKASLYTSGMAETGTQLFALDL